MRSIGQTAGIAVFGSVFNSTLNAYMQSSLQGSWPGVNISDALKSGTGVNMPAGLLEQLQTGLAGSLHLVFTLIFIMALVTFLISLTLPPHSKIMAQQKAD